MIQAKSGETHAIFVGCDLKHPGEHPAMVQGGGREYFGVDTTCWDSAITESTRRKSPVINRHLVTLEVARGARTRSEQLLFGYHLYATEEEFDGLEYMYRMPPPSEAGEFLGFDVTNEWFESILCSINFDSVAVESLNAAGLYPNFEAVQAALEAATREAPDEGALFVVRVDLLA